MPNQIQHVKDLQAPIAYFAGRDVSDSLKLAEAWAKRCGVVLNNYYVQLHKGTSILVDAIVDGQETDV